MFLMFEINKNNTRENEFWLKAIDTLSTIIITYIKENNCLDLRIFNEISIYQKDFLLENGEYIEFEGKLSEDGNEYDIKIISKEKVEAIFNFYYNLDDNIVVSTIEKGTRREITTIPNALLN